ncbi:hypothetical protein ABFS83_06G089900 [Erythranthe nasuta]
MEQKMGTVEEDLIGCRRIKKCKYNQQKTRDSITAAENRRLSGERRICQGMCFSIPTKRVSEENKNHTNKKISTLSKVSLDDNIVENEKPTPNASIDFMAQEIAINVGKPTCQIIKWDPSKSSWTENGPPRNTGSCPSKFLIMCLTSIQNALHQQNIGDCFTSEVELERPLFAYQWGLDFWNCYTNGKDVLESNGAEVEKIAWMVSTAADTISMKEREGVSFNGPFLLYLVPSQDRAYKVRQVCKPLKMVGIHTVSLHAGAPLDHQIHGLKRCEPEFIVSTTERLLELLLLNAVDISEVSLMVIDEGTCFDAIKSIRQFISGNPRTVVFCDSMKNHPSLFVL